MKDGQRVKWHFSRESFAGRRSRHRTDPGVNVTENYTFPRVECVFTAPQRQGGPVGWARACRETGTNGVIDLCTCWQLQKNQRKFTHILHTIVLRNKPALLHFPLLYLYSGVTEPAANQPDLLLPKANSEWHMGLAGVAGSLSHWTRIMRLSRCQASAALI